MTYRSDSSSDSRAQAKSRASTRLVDGGYFHTDIDRCRGKVTSVTIENAMASSCRARATSAGMSATNGAPSGRVAFRHARGKARAVSGERSASWVDLKRTYMELPGTLRWVYTVVANPAPYAEVATKLGFRPLSDTPADVGGRLLHSIILDMRTGIGRRMAGRFGRRRDHGRGDSRVALLDVEAHELVLPSGRVNLTSLEFGVMEYLQTHPGKGVSRYDLMEAVWGYRNRCQQRRRCRGPLAAPEARSRSLGGRDRAWHRVFLLPEMEAQRIRTMSVTPGSADDQQFLAGLDLPQVPARVQGYRRRADPWWRRCTSGWLRQREVGVAKGRDSQSGAAPVDGPSPIMVSF
jgi:hypothetical protein